MNFSYVLSALPSLLELVVLAVGIVLVRSRTSGSRRTLGAAGLGVMAAVVLLRGVGQLTLPQLYRTLGGQFATLYGIVSGVLALVGIGALALVIAALVARDQPSQSYPTYPNPYPTQPYPNEPDQR